MIIAAHQGVIDTLQRVRGRQPEGAELESYWTDLGGRVYPWWVDPNEAGNRPSWVSVPVDADAGTRSTEDVGRAVQQARPLTLYGFVRQSIDPGARPEQALVDATLALEADLVRLVLLHPTFGNTCKQARVLDHAAYVWTAGLSDEPLGAVQVDLELTLVMDANNLAPPALL